MVLDYFAFALALLAHLGVGRRLIKSNGVTAILASLLVIAGIISPLAYYQVSWIKYLLFAWSTVGLMLLIYDSAFRKEKILADISWKLAVRFGGIFVFFLFYLKGVNSANYVYESHDLLYFSWIYDFLRADYEGALRVSVAWPSLMSLNHLLPGAVVSGLSVFVMKPTIITAVELKYVFLALCFTSFIFAWVKVRQVSITLILFLFFCGFAIYGQEIGYSLRISSFLYLIILAELIKSVIFNGRDRDMVFFALFLIIAKAPIFFVAAVTAIWYLWKAPLDRFRTSTLIAILIVGINLLSWYLVTPPKYPMDVTFGMPVNAVGVLNAVQSWFMPDVVYGILTTKTPTAIVTLAMVIYIIIKYYVVYFITSPLRSLNATYQIDSSVMNLRDRLIGLDLYVFASLFAWIFIRHNGSIGHVAHAYLLMAFLTVFTLLDNFIIRPNKFKFIGLFFLMFFYGRATSFTNPFFYTNSETIKSSSAVKLKSIGLPSELNGFYVPPSGETPGVSQVKAAMFGLKLDSRTTPSPPGSQIGPFLIKE